MKILVDKLPESPTECRFHEGKFSDRRPSAENYIDGCAHSSDRNFECKIGQEGFECPYYREFKAVYETGGVAGNPHIVKRVPIKLVR